MADYDIIIRGGTVVDGTRTPRYNSDIAIKDGIIVKVGGLRGGTAYKVLDARGRIVAPGFVDLHTHYDAQIQWDPYCTLSGWHGVTSVALGNCGFGFAPSRVEDRDRAMLCMTRNEAIPYDAMKAGMLWDWVTFPEFMDTLSRIPKGLNCLTYVPLTPLYAWVMGWGPSGDGPTGLCARVCGCLRLVDPGSRCKFGTAGLRWHAHDHRLADRGRDSHLRQNPGRPRRGIHRAFLPGNR